MAMKISFDHKHYVPILRLRDAEMEGLGWLPPEDKECLTPLIELSPILAERKIKKRLTDRQFFLELVKQIISNWGYAPLFIDAQSLCGAFRALQNKHPIMFFAEWARNLRLPMIPAIGLRSSARYLAAVRTTVRMDGNGVCLRISEDDLRNDLLTKELRRFTDEFSLGPKDVDMLVDLKCITVSSMKLRDVCIRIPFLSSWRTFIVAGGAFPKDLADLEKNQVHELQRDDWSHWFEQVAGSKLPRRPTFGDYTIQHPVYYDPPSRPNPSASIR
jgi:hypothetical protein